MFGEIKAVGKAQGLARPLTKRVGAGGLSGGMTINKPTEGNTRQSKIFLGAFANPKKAKSPQSGGIIQNKHE